MLNPWYHSHFLGFFFQGTAIRDRIQESLRGQQGGNLLGDGDQSDDEEYYYDSEDEYYDDDENYDSDEKCPVH